MKKIIFRAGFILAFAALPLHAEMSVEVKTDRADAIYRCGEPIRITASVLDDNGKPVSGWRVQYELLADGGIRRTGSYLSDAQKPFELQTSLPQPGALRTEFTVLDKNGKRIPIRRKMDQWVCVSGRVGAVADPEKNPAGTQTP